MKLGYVIEVDGTKRPMTKEEWADWQSRLAVVPLMLPIALFIILINKLFKHNTLPTKE